MFFQLSLSFYFSKPSIESESLVRRISMPPPLRTTAQPNEEWMSGSGELTGVGWPKFQSFISGPFLKMNINLKPTEERRQLGEGNATTCCRAAGSLPTVIPPVCNCYRTSKAWLVVLSLLHSTNLSQKVEVIPSTFWWQRNWGTELSLKKTISRKRQKAFESTSSVNKSSSSYTGHYWELEVRISPQ